MERQQQHQNTAASIASPTVDLRLQYKTAQQNNSSQGQQSFSAEDKESKQS